jgi:hypothetical protein
MWEARIDLIGEMTMDTSSEVVELGMVMELTKGMPPGAPPDNIVGGTPNFHFTGE